MSAYKPWALQPGSTRLDPSARKKGECVLEGCDNRTSAPRYYFCDSHRESRALDAQKKKNVKVDRQPRQKVQRIESISDGTPPPSTPSPKADKELSDWLGTVLVILTYIVAMKAAGGQGITMRGADKELAAKLAMSDSQADAITRVIAKKVAPTKFYKKTGQRVVRTLDLELLAAMEAVYDYASTIAPYLKNPVASRAYYSPPTQGDINVDHQSSSSVIRGIHRVAD